VSHSLETARLGELDGLEALPLEEFGYDELLEQGISRYEIVWFHINLNACRELEIENAVVPRTFPTAVADHLRANGIELTPDYEFFAQRRRQKTEDELAGIRRAQKGAEAGMEAARELLARAEAKNGTLTVDGEELTCERIKAAIRLKFIEHGVSSDDFIVSHGPQTAIGHELGFGPIAPDEPVVIDLWPKDPESACYADMTRVFVVGEMTDEIERYQELVKEALDLAIAAIRPGVNGKDVHTLVCDFFHEHGYPTQLHKAAGEVLEDGFYHGTGHGVGLAVHEAPNLGRIGDELVAGDVITIEPGLYRHGFGGVRLEDLVLVTEDGHEVITDFPYELELA
jgi:Xaa-Pro aminopeptidase